MTSMSDSMLIGLIVSIIGLGSGILGLILIIKKNDKSTYFSITGIIFGLIGGICLFNSLGL